MKECESIRGLKDWVRGAEGFCAPKRSKREIDEWQTVFDLKMSMEILEPIMYNVWLGQGLKGEKLPYVRVELEEARGRPKSEGSLVSCFRTSKVLSCLANFAEHSCRD